MPTTQDYYSILGVSRGATADEIKSAHRKLVRKLHPDVNDAPDAEERFREVQEAYDILSDEQKRTLYDKVGHEAFTRGAVNAAAGRDPTDGWSGSGFNVDLGGEDIASLFESLFGGSGFGAAARGGGSPFGARARTHSTPRQGRDIEQEIDITFMTALQGGTEDVRISRGGVTKTYAVRIPKGADTGTKLRISGAGEPGAAGGKPGDCIVRLRVGRHPLYRREGIDLHLDLPLTIAEATSGATIKTPTPTGPIELRVPPGAPSGSKLRIKGRGVESDKGVKGDLYAVTKIIPPEHCSAEQHEQLRAITADQHPVRSGKDWQ
ncbi:MAG: DnaJ domain-containing protein [Phycisphaeraceae bacterium]|nr:DnaJ domain-containing protein [Phycisphaeraceae bacterium]